MDDRKVKFVSKTYEGKKHDKAIAEEEQYSLPRWARLIGDLGFQGYSPTEVCMILPFKKPRGGELLEDEKLINKVIASFRVRVEHVISSIKRLRIVKDIFRNFATDMWDKVMTVACSLHNFRTDARVV